MKSKFAFEGSKNFYYTLTFHVSIDSQWNFPQLKPILCPWSIQPFSSSTCFEKFLPSYVCPLFFMSGIIWGRVPPAEHLSCFTRLTNFAPGPDSCWNSREVSLWKKRLWFLTCSSLASVFHAIKPPTLTIFICSFFRQNPKPRLALYRFPAQNFSSGFFVLPRWPLVVDKYYMRPRAITALIVPLSQRRIDIITGDSLLLIVSLCDSEFVDLRRFFWSSAFVSRFSFFWQKC